MRNHFATIRRVLLGLGILFLATASACGAGGGSNATPSVGGSSPVAIEIPAVSGLPFASGTVISSSGSLSAPTKSMGKTVAITGNPAATANASFHACKTHNSIGMMTDAMLRSDVNTCILQAVSSTAEAKGVNLYSGKDVIYSVNTNNSTEAPNKFKVNITRDANQNITKSTLYGCNASGQNAFQQYQISGSTVTISEKGYDPVSKLVRSVISVEGTVSSTDSTQFVDSKSGTFRFSGDTLMTGANTGTGLMTQYPASVLVNTLFVPGGSQHLVGSADFSNATSGAAFDPRSYQMGAGAATFTQYDVTRVGCWEGTVLLPVTCLATDSNYIAMSREAATTPDILYDVYGFSGSEIWDCTGKDAFAVSDYGSAVNSCLEKFSLNWSEIDCSALDTNTTWLVQATDGTGGSLSTTEGSPTNVTTGAGILYISENWAANTSSFNNTTIQLTDLTTNAAVNLYGETWNSTHKELLAYYSYSNHNYKLVITGGASGIKSASGSTLSASKTYYFMVNGGYHAGWSVTAITPSGGNATPSATPLSLTGSTTNVSTATSAYAITFSEAMNASTINTNTITLSCNGNSSISGTLAAAQSPANTYVFSTSTVLAPLDLCTFVVNGGNSGVKDSDGDTSSESYSAGFRTGCTTNDTFEAYTQSLPYSTCWTEANISSNSSSPGVLPFTQNAAASGANAPRHSKTFGSTNITTTIEVASASALSDSGDGCGMRIMDPDSSTTGAVLSVKADGSGNIVVEKSTAAGSGTETATFVTGGSSFPGRSGSSIYLRLTQIGGSTTASYRVGNSGDFTTLGSSLSVSFGSTKRLDLFTTSDGNNSAVECSMDNFTASGASATGQD